MHINECRWQQDQIAYSQPLIGIIFACSSARRKESNDAPSAGTLWRKSGAADESLLSTISRDSDSFMQVISRVNNVNHVHISCLILVIFIMTYRLSVPDKTESRFICYNGE